MPAQFCARSILAVSARQRSEERARAVSQSVRECRCGSAVVDGTEQDRPFLRDIQQHARVSPAGKARHPLTHGGKVRGVRRNVRLECGSGLPEPVKGGICSTECGVTSGIEATTVRDVLQLWSRTQRGLWSFS